MPLSTVPSNLAAKTAQVQQLTLHCEFLLFPALEGIPAESEQIQVGVRSRATDQVEALPALIVASQEVVNSLVEAGVLPGILFLLLLLAALVEGEVSATMDPVSLAPEEV